MVICNEGIDRYVTMNHVSKVKKQMIPMVILNLMTKLRCLTSLGHPHTCYLCCQMVPPNTCQDARCRDRLELVQKSKYIYICLYLRPSISIVYIPREVSSCSRICKECQIQLQVLPHQVIKGGNKTQFDLKTLLGVNHFNGIHLDTDIFVHIIKILRSWS